MPERIARAMQELDERVVYISDWYPGGDPGDHVWLPRAADEGLTVMTRDLAIIPNPTMIALYRKHSAGGLFLMSGNDTKCELIQHAIRQWPRMKHRAKTTPRPFLFKVKPTSDHWKRLI
jgi:hypothetical protein